MDMQELPEELRGTVKRITELKPGEHMEIVRLADRLNIQVTGIDRTVVKLPVQHVDLKEIS